MTNTIITELLKRPIAYQPIIAKAFKSVKLGIFWSQFYYWHDKGDDPDGWIYKTQSEIYDETGLSRKEQETARKKGKELGVLEEKYIIEESKMFYRIDLEKTLEVIDIFLSKKPVVTTRVIRKSPADEAREFFNKEQPYCDVVEILEKNGLTNEQAYVEIQRFIAYWTEPSKSGRMVKWEMQKTFEIKRRLTTWLNNSNKFNLTNQNSKAGIVL